jgi:hypothetical protein
MATQLLAVWHRMQSDPRVLWALTVLLTAAITSLVLFAWPGRRSDSRNPRPVGPERVRNLASRGMSADRIARRTGLAHDAVVTIMRAAAAAADEQSRSARKSRPGAARIAASASPR